VGDSQTKWRTSVFLSKNWRETQGQFLTPEPEIKIGSAERLDLFERRKAYRDSAADILGQPAEISSLFLALDQIYI
jgi:hypothetical protein